MHSQSINIVPILLDNLLQDSELDTQDHGQLTTCIQIVGAVVRVIQLFETAKVDVGAGHTVDIGRLEHDAWGGRVGEFGGCADEEVEEVEGVELTMSLVSRPGGQWRNGERTRNRDEGRKTYSSQLTPKYLSIPSASSPNVLVLIPAEAMSYLCVSTVTPAVPAHQSFSSYFTYQVAPLQPLSNP